MALVALILPGVVCASCLNPQDDYNAYESRAADAQVPPPPIGTGEASTVDVASLRAPDAAFDDTHGVLICLSQLGMNLSEALLLDVVLQYTPNADPTSGGKLFYSSHWLAAGSTSINNPLTDDGSVVGPPPVEANIDSHGFGEVGLAMNLLPAAANAITDVPVQLSAVSIQFHVESPTQICANLGANIPPPDQVTLTPSENPCIYLPANGPGGTWGTVTTSDIHCP